MSSAVQSSPLPSTSSAAPSYAVQANSSFHVFQAASPSGSFSRTASVSEAPTPAPQVESTSSSHHENHASDDRIEEKTEPVVTVNVQSISEDVWRRGKQKGRRPEEVDIMTQTARRIAERLVADHAAVFHPDADTPFTDAEDVVKRLLPYHIYQHPREDLKSYAHPNHKGKRKATEEELLREEIAETRFALQCLKRKTALQKRFRAIRIREGKRNAPNDQAYVLAQAVLEADRADNATLNSEYRATRTELDVVDRKRKLAAAHTARTSTSQASGSASMSTVPPHTSHRPSISVAASTPSYSVVASTPAYAVTAATAAQSYSTTAASQYSQYRGYTYPYPQTYGTPYTYSPYATPATSTAAYAIPTTTYQATPQVSAPSVHREAPTGTAPVPSGTSNSGGVTTISQPAVTSEQAQTSTAVAASSATAARVITSIQPLPTPETSIPTAPIPVMLPVGALTTLSGMGIIPVPLANAPPVGQPQPAAVIKGTTQNGTMVNLEINVSALQASQAGALAVLLSALTSRGADVSAAASIAVATPASTSAEVGAGSGSEVSGSANRTGTEDPSPSIGPPASVE